jgi:hypothetical protein
MPAALSAAAASVEGDTPHPHRRAAKSPNCWASLCDVNACLEAPMNPTNPAGYAVDALDDACPLLPPLPSTARLLPYEGFRATTIPFKAETTPFEVGEGLARYTHVVLPLKNFLSMHLFVSCAPFARPRSTWTA